MKQLAITWADGSVITSRGLRAWVSSLRRAAPQCDVLICSPTPCSVEGARNAVCDIPGTSWLNRRWTAYADALRQSEADVVMLSDSRDVIFQSDPFTLLNGKDKIMVASEHFPSNIHPWCSQKEKEICAKLGWKSHTKDVINGGLQIGRRDAMLTFSYAIESVMRLGVFTTDQAFINWWFYERCPFPWSFGPPNWYIHGEAVRLQKQQVELRDGVAWSKNGSDAFEQATAFHQYDRCGHADIISRYIDLSKSPLLVLVAHFNENLDWLKKYDYDSVIVSKSPTPTAGTQALPNLGYEAQTWAWFFAENYDKLPDVTVCLQGSPQRKCPEPQMQSAISRMASGQFGFAPIAGNGSLTWMDDVTHHKGLPLLDWWKRLFKTVPPAWLYVHYGGQFAVSRDAVRSRPRAFWKKLAEEIKTKEDACCLERLWQFVFGGTL